MDSSSKKEIRSRWFTTLFELAHAEYQHQLWVKASNPDTIGSYTACVHTYFDELNLSNGYARFLSDGIISVSEFLMVVKLHAAFCNYTQTPQKKAFTDAEVLQDVDWRALTEIALVAWKALQQKVPKADATFMHELERRL